MVHYDKDDLPTVQSTEYETDILLYDSRENGGRIPRVSPASSSPLFEA